MDHLLDEPRPFVPGDREVVAGDDPVDDALDLGLGVRRRPVEQRVEGVMTSPCIRTRICWSIASRGAFRGPAPDLPASTGGMTAGRFVPGAPPTGAVAPLTAGCTAAGRCIGATGGGGGFLAQALRRPRQMPQPRGPP